MIFPLILYRFIRYVFSNLFDIDDDIFATEDKASDSSVHSSLTEFVNHDSFDAGFYADHEEMNGKSCVPKYSSIDQDFSDDIYCPFRVHKCQVEMNTTAAF